MTREDLRQLMLNEESSHYVVSQRLLTEILDELTTVTIERDKLKAELDAVREQFVSLKNNYDAVFDSREKTHSELVDTQKKLDAVPVQAIRTYCALNNNTHTPQQFNELQHAKIDVSAWLDSTVQP